MIATEQLYDWKNDIEATKKTAQMGADSYRKVKPMFTYYLHLVQVADAQLSLVQRLIRQSEQNDNEG